MNDSHSRSTLKTLAELSLKPLPSSGGPDCVSSIRPPTASSVQERVVGPYSHQGHGGNSPKGKALEEKPVHSEFSGDTCKEAMRGRNLAGRKDSSASTRRSNPCGVEKTTQ